MPPATPRRSWSRRSGRVRERTVGQVPPACQSSIPPPKPRRDRSRSQGWYGAGCRHLRCTGPSYSPAPPLGPPATSTPRLITTRPPEACSVPARRSSGATDSSRLRCSPPVRSGRQSGRSGAHVGANLRQVGAQVALHLAISAAKQPVQVQHERHQDGPAAPTAVPMMATGSALTSAPSTGRPRGGPRFRRRLVLVKRLSPRVLARPEPAFIAAYRCRSLSSACRLGVWLQRLPPGYRVEYRRIGVENDGHGDSGDHHPG